MGRNNYFQLLRRRPYGQGRTYRATRVNLRGAASMFGRNRMRRRGAGGRRRYSGKRRGYRRVRGYKRRKMPFGKRVKRQAVRAGFRSNKQYGSICRDLGTMFPECLSVKLYLHFQHPIQRAAGTAETFAAYDQYLRCYPYKPILNWNSNASSTAITNYTDIAAVSPMGWTRLIGSSGASAMYKECLVVSMAHDLRIDFQTAVTWTLSDAATDKIIAPARHFYHLFDTGGVAQTAPTTQALSDTYAQQPDVKMKVTSGQNQGNAGSADTTNNATMVVSPGRQVRWRGSIWPHKVQEIPLETYIGDKANWGTSTTLPSQYATLQFSGAMAGLTDSNTTTYGPTIRGLCTGSLCFTVLLKTPLAAVA